MTLELVPWRGARVPILSPGEISRYTTQDYINWITSSQGYMGPPMPVMTYGKNPVEPISNSFEGFALGMLYVDGPVAAVEAYRLRVFGQAPLLYQEIVDGRAGDLFDDDALDRLRTPWAGATLSDLMKRALIYGDFAGNAFVVDIEDELVLIRPDWVEIILEKRMFRGQQLGWKQLGIVYYEGGRGRGDGVPFLPGEYAHFIPGLPDPLATYRGMSWLTPLVREVQADKAAGDHKVAFFENSASPNLAVSLPKEVTPAQFNEFVELMDSKHKGVQNTGKTLYTGGGADVTVIGANMVQQDFAGVVGKGETRIANAGGVSPVLLSFSEGMQGSSLNAGNYTPAKRNFVDTTMRDLWANFAGSIGQMDAFKAPKKASRLWYDGRDIPFLHEDAKDLAEIQQTRASTLSSYVTNGWKPESAIKAVAQDDITLLEHSGAFSVQLQPPGAQMTPDTNGNGLADDAPTDGSAAPAPDFGALRADFWEFDEEDVLRAVEDLFDVDEEDLERARYDVRVEGGHVGGGRFRKLSDVAAALLQDWSKGDGPDDPLAKFDRPQLLRVMGDLRKKAVADGDHDRAARLTPRRGASEDQLKEALYNDVRGAVRQERDAGKPSAKFTLQGPDHRDLDVAVYKDKAGKPALFRESDNGKRGALVERFDSLDEMQAWADEHGEPKLSAWAGKESGAKAPAVKKAAPGKAAPRKAAPRSTAPDPDALDAKLRDAKPEDRRAILEDAANNQTQARRLASQLGVKGVSKLSRDDALDRIEAHYAPPVDHARVDRIASAFHEDWRKTRLQADGTFEPRVKKTKDQAWIDAHGTDSVDIANTSYSDLPDDWKAENRAAAGVVEGILQRHGGKVDLNDQAARLQVGEEIHQAWLSRNPWAAGGELDVPFADLPADEQAKDLDQVTVAMRALAPSSASPSPRGAAGKGVPAKPRKIAKAASDGLDSMDETALRKYAPEWEINPSGKSAEQLRRELRAKGAESPAVLQQKREAADANPDLGTDPLSQDIISLLTDGAMSPEHVVESLVDDGIAEPQARSYVGEIQALLARRGVSTQTPAARQAQLDTARTTAETLADLDELVHNGASPRALEHRLSTRRKMGSPDPVVDDLLAAARTGDRTQVNATLDRIAREHGLTATETAGAVVPFDRSKHELLGKDLPEGTPVLVQRRGYEYQRDGQTIRVSRATVLPATPERPVPAVDFLDRVHTGENAGLSPEDARAFAASGLSLEEWRAQRSEPFDEDDIERADPDGDVVEPDDDEDDEPDIDDILAMAAEDDDEDDASRAAGHDVTPGNDELHHYWTRGPGLARWAESAKPWTTLLANLVKVVPDKPLETLKRWTSRWFIEVFGFSSGSDLNRVTHGRPPRGKRVGPG